MIHPHGDSASKRLATIVATVDSATQGMLRLESTRADGVHTMITSARFTARTSTSTAPMPAVGDAEQKVAGHYYLQGEREAGSELILRLMANSNSCSRMARWTSRAPVSGEL